jgi:hypothetical protein
MIRKGGISALITAAVLYVLLIVCPWLVVVHVWGRLRKGV